jgi:hypothetical protein
MTPLTYRLLADAVLLLHVGIVLFIVGTLLLVIAGGLRGWQWVRNPWLRWLHLLAIAVVVLQAWFGALCPLTTLEMWLRREAGDASYDGAFIAHWLHELLFFDAPVWLFAVIYTLFGALVLAAWVWVRPHPLR